MVAVAMAVAVAVAVDVIIVAEAVLIRVGWLAVVYGGCLTVEGAVE